MQNMPSVPHKTQIEDGWCVPACAQTVLAYWGIEQNDPAIPEGGTQVALGESHLAWDTMANLYALLIKK